MAAISSQGSPLKELNEQLSKPIPSLPQNAPNFGSPQKAGSGIDCKSMCIASAGLGSPPDRLKVPKPFKYAERYTSPTDHMMSPVSKGLLARSRRGGALLPPSKIQSKIHELRSPELGQMQLQIDQKI